MKKKQEVQILRQCMKCFKVYKGSSPTCPYCGNNNGKTREQIKQEEKAELERIKRVEKFKRKNEVYQCKTMAELIAYAKEHNYKNPGYWAAMILNSRRKKGNKNG